MVAFCKATSLALDCVQHFILAFHLYGAYIFNASSFRVVNDSWKISFRMIESNYRQIIFLCEQTAAQQTAIALLKLGLLLLAREIWNQNQCLCPASLKLKAKPGDDFLRASQRASQRAFSIENDEDSVIFLGETRQRANWVEARKWWSIVSAVAVPFSQLIF